MMATEVSSAAIVAADAGSLPTSTGLPPRVAAVLAYSAWWLTGALFLVLEPEHPFVRFHAWQALRCFGLLWIVGVGLWASSLAMAFVSPAAFRVTAGLALAAWALAVVLWLACLVSAARGARWPVPLLGSRRRPFRAGARTEASS